MADLEKAEVKTKYSGGHPRFYKLLEEIAELHNRKNSDYAENENPLSNLRACEKLILVCPHCKGSFKLPAWVGVIVRLMDKWDRIIQLVPKIMSGEGPAVQNEAIQDTLRDNSVYSLLDIILLDEEYDDRQKSKD